MKIGSLFSGYGGLDLAVEAIFIAQPAWFCEFDKAPSKVLAHHCPDVPNYGDVTKVDWSQVEPIDVLTGGYPCQPFSQAGQRKGTNDERHLWPYVRDAIRVLRPQFVFLENVAGHRSLGFDRVLGDMAEEGLHVRWTSLRVSDLGGCHHRERLFILAANPNGIGMETREQSLPGAQELAQPRHGECTFSDTERPGWNERRGTAPAEAESGRAHGQPDRRGDDFHWGAYAPAVRRWERVTRPAPAPTELNAKGKPRLNAKFAEWMMGLPDGWVTSPDIGLTRAQQLKAIGNGVCPQQGAAALRQLLTL